MLRFLSITTIILSAAVGLQAQLTGGVVCADPNYSGACFNTPTGRCTDLTALFPQSNGASSFLAFSGSNCFLYIDASDCAGGFWSSSVALNDLSRFTFDGTSLDNAAKSVACH